MGSDWEKLVKFSEALAGNIQSLEILKEYLRHRKQLNILFTRTALMHSEYMLT